MIDQTFDSIHCSLRTHAFRVTVLCEAVLTIRPVKNFREESHDMVSSTMEELGSTGKVNKCKLLRNVVTHKQRKTMTRCDQKVIGNC